MTLNYNSRVLLQTPATFLFHHYNCIHLKLALYNLNGGGGVCGGGGDDDNSDV